MSERVGEQATARVGKAESEPLVPVWGLAIAGVVIVVLIVTIARNWLWGIDFFHVVGGALWFSIDLFMGFVIGPLLARLDVPARMAVTRRLMPKMLIIMPVVVISTLTAAWQLAQLVGLVQCPIPAALVASGSVYRRRPHGHYRLRRPRTSQHPCAVRTAQTRA